MKPTAIKCFQNGNVEKLIDVSEHVVKISPPSADNSQNPVINCLEEKVKAQSVFLNEAETEIGELEHSANSGHEKSRQVPAELKRAVLLGPRGKN